jgi:hypothetical protein
MDGLLALPAEGTLRPVIDRVFPLTEAGAAHRYLPARKRKGKCSPRLPEVIASQATRACPVGASSSWRVVAVLKVRGDVHSFCGHLPLDNPWRGERIYEIVEPQVLDSPNREYPSCLPRTSSSWGMRKS